MNDARRDFPSFALTLGLLLAVGSSSCNCDCPESDGAQRPDDTQRPDEPYSDSVCLADCRQAPPCEELCSPNRRVSLPSPGGCPAADGWTVEPLVKDDAVAEQSGLLGVCTYEWTEKVAPTSFPAGTVPDCLVAPTAPAVANRIQDFVGRRLRDEQYGTYEVPNLPGDVVTIAVVDTAPHGTTTSGAASHGRAMASIVDDIACGSTPKAQCAREVASFVGLPRVRGAAPYSAGGGGFYGYQSDLAKGIAEAVHYWGERRRGKLIINLSVGWEPACDTRGSELVRRTIARATTQGALVLAAAGNRRPGSCATGPTAPGAWGNQSVPSRGGGMVPLLYGITPVDEQLRDLVTFRPGSNTAFATRGFMIVTTDESVNPPEDLGPYSGSSVSTAVASGIAALIWSYHPELSAQQVMDLLWESGAQRPEDPSSPSSGFVLADSYFGASAPEQHVVSACRALERAACLGSAPCGPTSCVEPSTDVGAMVAGIWAGASPIKVVVDGQSSSIECSSCGGSSPTRVFGATSMTTPPDPWVVPQPDDPPCPLCDIELKSVSSTAVAHLSRATAYNNYTLASTTITLWNAAEDSENHQYGAPTPLPLLSGQTYAIEDPDFLTVSGSTTKRAYVSMTFSGPGTPFTVGNEITVTGS